MKKKILSAVNEHTELSPNPEDDGVQAQHAHLLFCFLSACRNTQASQLFQAVAALLPMATDRFRFW